MKGDKWYIKAENSEMEIANRDFYRIYSEGTGEKGFT